MLFDRIRFRSLFSLFTYVFHFTFRMFHLLADDTGASAVWVAQRVPDDHITAVANQFVIGPIDVKDSTNFMASGKDFFIFNISNFFVFLPQSSLNIFSRS